MTSNLPAWTALDSGALPLPSALPGGAGSVTAIVATSGAVEAGWASGGAVALARSWATAGHRVVLADGDVLVPRLHTELGLRNHEGLSDVLLWGASVRRVSQAVEDAGFYLMSAGTVVADGSEPFEASRWAHLCNGFREAGVVLAVFTPETSVSAGSILAQASEVVLLAEASEDLGRVTDRIGLPIRGLVRRGDSGAEGAEARAAAPAAPEKGGQEEAAVVGGETDAATTIDGGQDAESATPAPSRDMGEAGPGETEAPEAGESDAAWTAEPAAAWPAEADAEEVGEPQAEGAGVPATVQSADLDAPRVPPIEDVLSEAAALRPRASRGRPVVLFVVLLVILLAIVAALLGYVRIPGIPSLGGGPARSAAGGGVTAAAVPVAAVASHPSGVSSVATHATELMPETTPPAEVTPVAGFDIAVAAYKSAETASARAARLRRSLPGAVVTTVPVEVEGTVFHRVLVGVAADSTAALALAARVARLTGLSADTWVIRSTPLAFTIVETSDWKAAASRVEDLLEMGLPAYALAVDYSDGSLRYRVYVGSFANRAEASLLSALLHERGLTDVTLSDRFGRLPE
jgi:cell division septation protein DedD